MLAKQLKRIFMAGFAVCLLASAPALHATLPQLYPTFTAPTTITAVNLAGTSASIDDMMAEVTLQGAYNQLQGHQSLICQYQCHGFLVADALGAFHGHSVEPLLYCNGS